MVSADNFGALVASRLEKAGATNGPAGDPGREGFLTFGP
jgi:hypothetical protein